MGRPSFLPFLLFHFNVVVLAAVTPGTTAACKALAEALPSIVYYETGATASKYKLEQSNYWSVVNQEEKPACIVQPTDTETVSKVVKILNQNKDVKFAVKSGGHDPNPGHSASKDGIVIALSHLNGTSYDAAKKVAYMKPGGHWYDVIPVLEKSGVTVVGGRLGIVGIGGYLAQGGVSFLSAQYGLAADNIVGYEVVTANGSVVNITPESNKDLMVAMRGGGNMYGIITKFTLRTYPIGKVWGGYRIYTTGKRDQIYSGFHEFNKNPNADPKAAIIVNTSYATQGTIIFMVFFFYDGPKPPAGAFGKLIDVPALIDLCTERTYTDLLVLNSRGVDLLGSRTSFRSVTLPFVESETGLYKELENTYTNITSSFMKNHFLATSTVAMQAFPASIGKATAERGGNAMGLTANDKPRFVLEINTLWRDAKEDTQVYGMARDLTDWLGTRLKTIHANSRNAETYLPFFMNDAAYDQDVFGSYKDAAKFRTLQQSVDPTGFWKRSNGFQMS